MLLEEVRGQPPPIQHLRVITRKVDVRLPGKGNSNSHDARPVHLIITMIEWIRTSRLSIKRSLSLRVIRASGCVLLREVPGQQVIRNSASSYVASGYEHRREIKTSGYVHLRESCQQTTFAVDLFGRDSVTYERGLSIETRKVRILNVGWLDLYCHGGYERGFPRSRGYPPEKGRSRGTFIRKNWFYNTYFSSLEWEGGRVPRS